MRHFRRSRRRNPLAEDLVGGLTGAIGEVEIGRDMWGVPQRAPLSGPPTRESALARAVARSHSWAPGSAEYDEGHAEIRSLLGPVRGARKSSSKSSSGSKKSTAHLFKSLNLGNVAVGKKASKRVKKALKDAFGKHARQYKSGRLVLNPIGKDSAMGIVEVGASAAGGAIVAKALPGLIARFTGMPVDRGVLGLVAQVLSAGVAAALGSRFVSNRSGAAMLVGGLGVTGVDVIRNVTARVAPVASAPAPKTGAGDYMQLSGPVPAQLFANTPPLSSGVGDYIEFKSPAAGVLAESASFAPSGWQPGNEGF